MLLNIVERLLRPGAAKQAGLKLYGAVVAQSRLPVFYLELGAPDTVEGRFEVYTLNVSLLLVRLKGQGAVAKTVSQSLFDAYVQGLDDALRDMGVGDLSVGKKMRKLGEAFYGRAKAYEEALAALPDEAALRELLARTVHAEVSGADADRLAAYAAAARASLTGQPLERLTAGDVSWPAP